MTTSKGKTMKKAGGSAEGPERPGQELLDHDRHRLRNDDEASTSDSTIRRPTWPPRPSSSAPSTLARTSRPVSPRARPAPVAGRSCRRRRASHCWSNPTVTAPAWLAYPPGPAPGPFPFPPPPTASGAYHEKEVTFSALVSQLRLKGPSRHETLNHIELIGYVGRYPEAGQRGSGTPLARFNLATTKRWRGPTTNPRSTPTGTESLLGPAANQIVDHLHKGLLVRVDGELRVSTYEKDGITRTSVEVRGADWIDFGVRARPGEVPPANCPSRLTPTRPPTTTSRSDPAAAAPAPFRLPPIPLPQLSPNPHLEPTS